MNFSIKLYSITLLLINTIKGLGPLFCFIIFIDLCWCNSLYSENFNLIVKTNNLSNNIEVFDNNCNLTKDSLILEEQINLIIEEELKQENTKKCQKEQIIKYGVFILFLSFNCFFLLLNNYILINYKSNLVFLHKLIS